MKLSKQLPNFVLSVGVASLAISIAAVLTRPEASAGRRQELTQNVAELPKIISKVKSIEVIGATIIRTGRAECRRRNRNA